MNIKAQGNEQEYDKLLQDKAALEAGGPNKTEFDKRHRHGSQLMSSDRLFGNHVFNMEGDTLGRVKDIMLDFGNGKIAYAVLSYPTLLGLNEKLFAVPWDELKLDAKNERFIMDIDKETLRKTPGFDKEKWPNVADQQWATQAVL